MKEIKIFLIVLASQSIWGANVFQKIFEWRAMDYAFPSVQDKVKALLTNRFIPENNLPVGIEVWNDKLFISVPRWRQGIPSTLNYVPLNQDGNKSPALIPYPSWKQNEAGNCEEGLTTVYRIKADECDRLWVLDTGTFGIDDSTTNPCPYALNVFDLHTNQRLRRYELRKEDINARTFIANIAVDVRKSCDDTFAYMSDELGYGLIAYSWDLNKSWRFEHSYFMPDPLAGDFNIGGLNFQWGEEGIFGMSLSPIQDDGFRVLYFSPLASNREFAVSTKILRDSSKVEESYHDFVALEDRGPNSHTTARVMDENGIQFFNLIDRNAVGCWNYKTIYHPTNLGVVDRDDEEMIFPCDVKVDRHQHVWMMSDRMPNFLLSNLNYSDVNFRVFFAPIDRLIQGTPCQPQIPYDNPLHVGVKNGWTLRGNGPNIESELYGIHNGHPVLAVQGYGRGSLNPKGVLENGQIPIPVGPGNGQIPIPVGPGNGQYPPLPNRWNGNGANRPPLNWPGNGQNHIGGWPINLNHREHGWNKNGPPPTGWIIKNQGPNVNNGRDDNLIFLNGQSLNENERAKPALPGTYYQDQTNQPVDSTNKQQFYVSLLLGEANKNGHNGIIAPSRVG